MWLFNRRRESEPPSRVEVTRGPGGLQSVQAVQHDDDGVGYALRLVSGAEFTELEHRQRMRAITDTDQLGVLAFRLGEAHARFVRELERRQA